MIISKLLTEPLAPAHGTLRFRGTPVGKRCRRAFRLTNDWETYASYTVTTTPFEYFVRNVL